MKNETLKINEIFYSLEGETTLVGAPMHFVRLAGCNLSCSWCDTEYARSDIGAKAIKITAIEKAVGAPAEAPVCITGGEPLAQPNVRLLLRRLVDAGRKVLLETNGTISIADLPPEVRIIMDVKPPGSGVVEQMAPGNIELLRPTDELKFVLSGRDDYDFAVGFCRENELFSRATVLFGPVWGRLDPTELADWIIADKIPARYNVGLHKILWGEQTRGK